MAEKQGTDSKEIRLTRTMLEQMLSYVEERDRDVYDGGGWYYGNKIQFEKRHETIKAWIEQRIKRFNEAFK